MDVLLQSIQNRTGQVGVVGLGYVGLPLAMLFARAGFPVTGFDVDITKVNKLNAGLVLHPAHFARRDRAIAGDRLQSQRRVRGCQQHASHHYLCSDAAGRAPGPGSSLH